MTLLATCAEEGFDWPGTVAWVGFWACAAAAFIGYLKYRGRS